MKILILSLLTFTTVYSFSQTNVISARSHSGDIAEAMIEVDNFGLPPTQTTVDTVILYNETCLIEIKTVTDYNGMDASHYSDTICDHPYLLGLGANQSEIKKHYPRNTKFMGFKKAKKNHSQDYNIKDNNVFLLGMLLFLGLLSYIMIPIKKG